MWRGYDPGQLAEAGGLPLGPATPDFHRRHRSALLRKDPGYYRDAFTDVPDDLPYAWPVSATLLLRRRPAEPGGAPDTIPT